MEFIHNQKFPCYSLDLFSGNTEIIPNINISGGFKKKKISFADDNWVDIEITDSLITENCVIEVLEKFTGEKIDLVIPS